MSGRTAKVKTRAKSRHHKNPRWKVLEGPTEEDPHIIEQEGDVLPPRTRLQHQGDSERLQQRRHGAILRVTRLTEEGPGRTTTKAGTTETTSSGARRPRKIENSFMLRRAGKYNQPQRRRCGAQTGREKPDLPTEPNSFPMQFCSRLDGRYSEAYKPRSRGYPAPSPQQSGMEGKDKHAQLRSERLERRTCSMLETRQGLGGRAVTW